MQRNKQSYVLSAQVDWHTEFPSIIKASFWEANIQPKQQSCYFKKAKYHSVWPQEMWSAGVILKTPGPGNCKNDIRQTQRKKVRVYIWKEVQQE